MGAPAPSALGFALHLACSGSTHQPQHSPAERRRRLINVSGKLRLYCYSKKMAPFISAPSAQAHLLLQRQPTRTQQVCTSGDLECFLPKDVVGLEMLILCWLPAVKLEEAFDRTSPRACATHCSIRPDVRVGTRSPDSFLPVQMQRDWEHPSLLIHSAIYWTNNKEDSLSARHCNGN